MITKRLQTLSRREWAFAVLLVLFASELFVVQHRTFSLRAELSLNLVDDAMRLLLNTFWFCTILTLIRTRWLAVLVAVTSTVVNIILLSYFRQFSQPLPVSSVLYLAGEGVSAASSVFALISPFTWAIVSLSFACKAGLACFAYPGKRRPLVWMSCFAAIWTLAVVTDNRLDTRGWRSLSYAGSRLGYLSPWVAWIVSVDSDDLVARISAKTASETYDLEGVLDSLRGLKRIIVVQAESLDYANIGLTIEGKAITPFLNRLKDHSIFLKVKAPRMESSADADFTFLTAKHVVGEIIPYKIPTFPFERVRSFPKIARELGFESSIVHGNYGSFFERKTAFSKLGFDRTFFLTELEKLFGLRAHGFGLRDDDTFAAASRLLARAKRPQFQMTITMSSHAPFDQLGESDRRLFSRRSGLGYRYLDSINFVDRHLETFVESQPRDTLVVIYGDHEANVGEPVPETDRPKDVGWWVEYVPFYVYRVGDRLNERVPLERRNALTDGHLSFLDAVVMLNRGLAREGVVTSAQPLLLR